LGVLLALRGTIMFLQARVVRCPLTMMGWPRPFTGSVAPNHSCPLARGCTQMCVTGACVLRPTHASAPAPIQPHSWCSCAFSSWHHRRPYSTPPVRHCLYVLRDKGWARFVFECRKLVSKMFKSWIVLHQPSVRSELAHPLLSAWGLLAPWGAV